MKFKLLASLWTFLVFWYQLPAQNHGKQLSFGIENQLLIGGEFNASYDLLFGGRGNYFFKERGSLSPFLSFGLATDILSPSSQFLAADAQFGFVWNRHKIFSLQASLGGHLIQESHSFQLIEGHQDWQNATLGLSGSLGLNLSLSASFNLQINLRQTNLIFTSLGLGFFYSL